MRPEVEVLEHETQFAANPIELLAVGGDQVALLVALELELLAGHQNLALMGVFQQVDAAQKGGFSGA